MKRHSRDSSQNILRFFRSIISIVILTAIVLGVSYFVKGVSTFDAESAYRLSEPVLSKAGLDDTVIGEVAGKFVARMDEYNEENETDNTEEEYTDETVSAENTVTPKFEPGSDVDSPLLFTLAVMADSHNYNGVLAQALNIASEKDVEAVIYLGDYTDWGDVDSLKNAKTIMDNSGLEYYSLPGDHDLAQSVGTKNFLEVFGKNKYSLVIKGMKLVLFDNSANFTPLGKDDLSWFEEEVADADYVFLSQPIYHSSGFKMMGYVDGEETPEVAEDRERMLKAVRSSPHVKAVISADLHQSGNDADPERSDLYHIVSGALTESRNLQSSRFIYLNIRENGYNVEEFMLE